MIVILWEFSGVSVISVISCVMSVPMDDGNCILWWCATVRVVQESMWWVSDLWWWMNGSAWTGFVTSTVIKSLYKDGSCCIKMLNSTSRRFNISRNHVGMSWLLSLFLSVSQFCSSQRYCFCLIENSKELTWYHCTLLSQLKPDITGESPRTSGLTISVMLLYPYILCIVLCVCACLCGLWGHIFV